MPNDVIATANLFVRLSVTFRCFVQTNEDTIVRFSASCRTIILVSGEVKFMKSLFTERHPQQRRKVKRPPIAIKKLANNQP